MTTYRIHRWRPPGVGSRASTSPGAVYTSDYLKTVASSSDPFGAARLALIEDPAWLQGDMVIVLQTRPEAHPEVWLYGVVQPPPVPTALVLTDPAGEALPRGGSDE